MRTLALTLSIGLLLSSAVLPARSPAASSSAAVAAAASTSASPISGGASTSLATLVAEAQARFTSSARVPIGHSQSALDPELRLNAAHDLNYVRAMTAQMPQAARPLAALVYAVLYRGAVPTSVKAAMGAQIARVNGSPYVAAHMIRVLRGAGDRGKALLASLEADDSGALEPAERAAMTYADRMTRSVHGVTPEDFARTRGAFNDAEIVELTITVAFFNYFTRFTEALRLPVEPWIFSGSVPPAPNPGAPAGSARVALISDEEIEVTSAAAAAAKDREAQTRSLGLGMANSQRAMLRAPALALPWRAYGATVREKETVGRDIKLQISFAVSVVDECRYCTLHQVLGLRRLGVEPAKLMAMRKDDSALTPREAVAVRFARALTTRPGKMTDEDYNAVRAEFGELGALEVLLQTCNFAFMNRFTDGLQLPSEDEAIRVYQETYGAGWPSSATSAR